MTARIQKLGTGEWFFEWDCGVCMDSGISVSATLGPDQCRSCEAASAAVSIRLFGAVSVLLLKSEPVDYLMLDMARALVSRSAAEPLQGEALAALLHVGERRVKRTAQRLRSEWRLPVCGRREEPFGYFFAARPEEFLDWMRTTRSQAVSELATAYQLFRTNFPALSGQQSLEFVNDVSRELQEAIR